MADIDRLSINGFSHSWGSLKLKIAGERITGISAIGYGDKLEKAFGYGMGRDHKPRSQSRGKYTPDNISMKMPTSTADEIRDRLSQRGDGTSYGDVHVEIVLHYVEPKNKDVTVVFESCSIIECTTSHEEGPDELVEEIVWSTFGIIRNGKTLYKKENAS